MFTHSWETSFILNNLLFVNVHLLNKDFIWTSVALILIASYFLEGEGLSEICF